jgi:hypothetical protein
VHEGAEVSTAIPIPDLPAHVTLEWTPTRSALIVECSACRGATALYSPLLFRSPDFLADAVEEHRPCRPVDPAD